MKIAGADPDFHRRDLYDAIDGGDFPEWEFGVQLLTQEQADALPFDILDATKLIPEELYPVKVVGRMVLDRNPDNFFAETEQVAFLPTNVPPGIDFSEDPLLQGRLFSYQDTQLSRLGSVNFHQLPINRAKGCPVMNMQRDGHMQMDVPVGRANYEPNGLAQGGEDGGPRESLAAGYKTTAVPVAETKVRVRAESFADHYSQARLFFRSQAPSEQAHLATAIVFELSKVTLDHVRKPGCWPTCATSTTPWPSGSRTGWGWRTCPPPRLPPSRPRTWSCPPALRIVGKYPESLEGPHRRHPGRRRQRRGGGQRVEGRR